MAYASNSVELWLALLRCKKYDRGETGLTPSFLIGAALPGEARPHSEDAAYSALQALLESLRAAPTNGDHIVIKECWELRQPIAALYGPNEYKPECEAVIDHRSQKTSLYAQLRYFATTRDVDSLVAGLWKSFRSPLISGTYSFWNREYREFNAADLALIESAKRRLSRRDVKDPPSR